MSTTYKTFDEFPSVLDLPVFSFYWKLVQHAVQFRGDINALLLTNETKILKKIANWPAKGSLHIPKITCFVAPTATVHNTNPSINGISDDILALNQSGGQLKTFSQASPCVSVP